MRWKSPATAPTAERRARQPNGAGSASVARASTRVQPKTVAVSQAQPSPVNVFQSVRTTVSCFRSSQLSRYYDRLIRDAIGSSRQGDSLVNFAQTFGYRV